MKKKCITQFAGWLFAALIGFLIVNLICFAYERQPGWLDTPNGATASVWEPGALIIHGKEGFSITRVDENGYLNPNKKLADRYVLMLGASHTQGKEISQNKKYSVLVNDYLGNDGLLHTYNISCDGSFLPTQIKYFKAAMEAYPDAEVVTIEIYNTDFSVEQINKSLEQVNYNPDDSATKFDHFTLVEKIKIALKDYIPMISRIKDNIQTSKKASQKPVDYTVDFDQYADAINKALSTMRCETDSPIVFVYHPTIEISQDGSMQLKYSTTWDLFKAACEDNDIDIIDSGDDFIEYYSRYHKVPYGFINTTYGTGHLNELGHRIIADEIIKYLEGLK